MSVIFDMVEKENEGHRDLDQMILSKGQPLEVSLGHKRYEQEVRLVCQPTACGVGRICF